MTGFTMIRRIAARPAIIFDALITPEGVAAWWGPDDLPVIAVDIDARIGGAFRVRFRTVDGLEHEASGHYLEIAPPRRLAMSLSWSFGGVPEEAGRKSRVEVDLRPIDTGTELTFTHAELNGEASAESHEWGWTRALEKLIRQVETAPE